MTYDEYCDMHVRLRRAWLITLFGDDSCALVNWRGLCSRVGVPTADFVANTLRRDVQALVAGKVIEQVDDGLLGPDTYRVTDYWRRAARISQWDPHASTAIEEAAHALLIAGREDLAEQTVRAAKKAR